MANVLINDLTLTSPVIGAHQFEIDIGNGTSSGRVTGTSIRTFVLTGFTANRAVEIDGSGNLVPSAVTLTELNTLDGITSTTAELNILDGVTSTAAELNILDGATLTVTELNFVDGVTSAIQTQIDNKVSFNITGLAADTPVAADEFPFHDASGGDQNKVTLTNLKTALNGGYTASRALETDGSGVLQVSGTTAADLDEIEGLANFDQGLRAFRVLQSVSSTGAQTLGTTHQNGFLYMTNSSTTTWTIPPNSTTAFNTGTEIEIWRSDASVVITEGSGVTLNGHDGTNAITTTATIGTQHTGMTIKKVATDTWVAFGRYTSS